MTRKSNLITVVVASAIAAAAATVNAQDAGFLRNLAKAAPTATPTPPPKIPKFYDDNISVPFVSILGCGACIRGGYIYCIPGAEGSDPSTWGTNKAVCCQSSANCPALTNKAYTCSNAYSDKSLSKAMCPFRKSACGNS